MYKNIYYNIYKINMDISNYSAIFFIYPNNIFKI